jgi:hypothetical protein
MIWDGKGCESMSLTSPSRYVLQKFLRRTVSKWLHRLVIGSLKVGREWRTVNRVTSQGKKPALIYFECYGWGTYVIISNASLVTNSCKHAVHLTVDDKKASLKPSPLQFYTVEWNLKILWARPRRAKLASAGQLVFPSIVWGKLVLKLKVDHSQI